MTNLFTRPLIVSPAEESAKIPKSRANFLKNYREQLAAAEREEAGNFDLPPRFRKLYKQTTGGRYVLHLRYNSRPIHIDGKDALDCGPGLDSVISAITEVIAVAEAGKLDSYINQVASAIGAGGRKATKKR